MITYKNNRFFPRGQRPPVLYAPLANAIACAARKVDVGHHHDDDDDEGGEFQKKMFCATTKASHPDPAE